jgi:hypothetical protein
MNRHVLAVAGAGVIALAGCTHDSSPNAAPAARGSSSTPIRPVSCSEQYRTWTDAEGKSLMGVFAAVTSASKARDGHALKKALKQAKPAVAKATRHPIPACADPRGYWTVLLMHVNAAAAGDGSASTVRAALQGVRQIHHQLLTEVKETAQ